AQALIRAAESRARRDGLPRIHVGVRLALTANRRLFARFGFRETVHHTHEGFTAPTWVEMEKPLG
ncbi:MAG TPA: GNAT family N-acetyltransferase, partial [Rhizomicrobium sp.]